MKETHIFYAPQAGEGDCELPKEEAVHAVRVLRMKEGDELMLTDGEGLFYEAEISIASPKHCRFNILRTLPDEKLWKGEIHLAVAPTKNMDRMEWFAEKATEIGIDRIALIDCKNSERHVVKTERLEKIVVGAMKQSHKAFKPLVEEMTPFARLIAQDFDGQRFIAHCYTPEEIGLEEEDASTTTDAGNNAQPISADAIHICDRHFLGNLLEQDGRALVLIGPEGDFSIAEVKAAVAAGFRPISLGRSRLRTETAALIAVHLMYLAKRR